MIVELPSSISEALLEYVKEVRNIMRHLRRGIKLLNDVRVSDALEELSKAIKADTKADELRRDILFNLEKVIRDSATREAIAHILRRLDLVSEMAKEASRYLSIIPYLEIPDDIKLRIESLSRLGLEACDILVSAVAAILEGEAKRAIEFSLRIEEVEEKADDVTLEARRALVDAGEKISNSALVLMIFSFIESLESVTDYAEDAADYIRAIALRKH
ncbi:MAG: DUF47 family protein [Desulfurococcales archaeon]|nr:DUF47 family protein [Desulfurococcales archaeon]